MPNQIRHVVSGAIGVVLTPVILFLLMFGIAQLLEAFRTFDLSSADRYLGALLVALAAAGIGALVGSWLSPVGSLVAGVAFTGLGAVGVVSPSTSFDLADVFQADLQSSLFSILTTGTALLVGIVLLVASIPPSRWKAPAGRPPVWPAGPPQGYDAYPGHPGDPPYPGNPGQPG